MPSPSLLITQNFNSPLATQFALHLLLNSKSDGNNVAQLFALVSPLNGTKMSKCLKPFVDNGRLCVLFGNASAQKLVKEVVEKNKILSIFVLLNGQNKDDYNEEDETFSIVSETRSFLTSMCSLLECLRQCNGITTQSIVVLFHSSNAVTEDFFLPQFDNDDQQTHPIIKCKSKESALFSSLHALCHSFAVSYKMNIQIGLINQTSELIENGKAFKAFEDLASLRMEEKAKINFFELGKMIGDIETFNISRVLLFSNIYLNEQQKQEAINTLLSSQNCTTFELNKNNFIWAKTRPGNEKDEQIEGEIFDKWPSHLLLFNEDEESGILWENGGPSNLKENICSNLFSPWLLKQICSEFGICFIQFPQQNDEENQMENRRNIVRFFEKKLEKVMMLKI